MTRFVKLRSVPGAFYLAVLALGLIGPLAGCGNLGKPFQGSEGTATRKIGAITVSVAWPDRSRLIPLASNSIQVTVRDSSNAIVAQKLLVRPADIAGTPATASFTAANLKVPDTFTIKADAYPTAAGTGTIQSTGSTSSTLTLDNPTDTGRTFKIGSTIKSVVISIPPADGSTTSQNLGKGRTRLYQATAYDGAAGTGSVVLTTPSKWKWEVVSPGIGNFQGANSDGTFNGDLVTYIAGDPGSTFKVTTIKVTETESSGDDPANPARYTTSTTAQTVPLGLSTVAAWSRFHATAQNTGIGTVGTSIASSVSQVWGGPVKVAPRNIVFSSGIVDGNGAFYIGAYAESTGKSGQLFSVSADKSIVSSFPAAGRIESSPLVSQDGTVYFGSYDDTTVGGYVYAVRRDTTTGGLTQLWRTQLGGPVFGTPALDKNGYLYVATAGADRSLYKLDSLNGKAVASWQTKADTPILSSPALSVDEATVYFVSSGETLADGSRNGAKLYSVATATGVVKWTYSTVDKSVVMSSPVISGGRVFFGTLEGLFFGVDAASGTDAWTQAFDSEAQIYSTAAISSNGSTVYFSTFDNISGINNNRVIALDTATGTLVWSSAPFTAGFTSSPAVSADGQRLYLGGYDGNIYGINTSNGAIAWTFTTGVTNENFDSSPCIGPNGDVFIGSYTGDVYRLH